ncbi:MAG: TraB/GumN family protein [Pseudomonadota bacterium]
MKHLSLFTSSAAVIALFAANPAFADSQDTAVAPAPTAVTTAAASDGPALWKVADEDTTIYLFGTIHALPKEIEWYDAEIAAALTSSDAIVTEIKMDAESEAAMQKLSMTKGMLPAGSTLPSLLDEEQTTKYEAALGSIGAPAAAFDQFKPWLAGLTLTVVPLMQQGYDLEAGVDKVLIGKAGDKEQQALETAEFQLNIFDSLPQESQVEFLMAAVDGMDEVKTYLDRMVAEWIEGDADELAAIMNESLEDPKIAEKLLYERNNNWAEWIDTRLETPGTIFIAVGAGHLAGEKSVQDYLADRGIETTRVQ